MNTIKHFISISAMALGLGLAVGNVAHAATESEKPAASQAASLTDGEIRKIDPEAGKLTIKHGEIKNLDMPGMTMVFTAKDKALLANLKAGDKIKFAVVNEGGKMVVTDIQPAQ
jgi:Cu/Ag efflux protein CusF